MTGPPLIKKSTTTLASMRCIIIQAFSFSLRCDLKVDGDVVGAQVARRKPPLLTDSPQGRFVQQWPETRLGRFRRTDLTTFANNQTNNDRALLMLLNRLRRILRRGLSAFP